MKIREKKNNSTPKKSEYARDAETNSQPRSRTGDAGTTAISLFYLADVGRETVAQIPTFALCSSASRVVRNRSFHILSLIRVSAIIHD